MILYDLPKFENIEVAKRALIEKNEKVNLLCHLIVIFLMFFVFSPGYCYRYLEDHC